MDKLVSFILGFCLAAVLGTGIYLRDVPSTSEFTQGVYHGIKALTLLQNENRFSMSEVYVLAERLYAAERYPHTGQIARNMKLAKEGELK